MFIMEQQLRLKQLNSFFFFFSFIFISWRLITLQYCVEVLNSDLSDGCDGYSATIHAISRLSFLSNSFNDPSSPASFLFLSLLTS